MSKEEVKSNVRKRISARSISTSVADDTTNNKYQNGTTSSKDKLEKMKEIPFYGIKM